MCLICLRRAGVEGSRKNTLHHFAVNIGQPETTTLEIEREAFVIQSEAVKDGCLKIVNMDGIFDDMKPEVVGFSVGDAAAYSTAG